LALLNKNLFARKSGPIFKKDFLAGLSTTLMKSPTTAFCQIDDFLKFHYHVNYMHLGIVLLAVDDVLVRRVKVEQHGLVALHDSLQVGRLEIREVLAHRSLGKHIIVVELNPNF